jgi:sec-independent protein translocase protein TatA
MLSIWVLKIEKNYAHQIYSTFLDSFMVFNNPYQPYLTIIMYFYIKFKAMFGLGTPEIILILAVVLVLFGGKKIPELMRGLGQGVREFNAAKSNIKSEIEEGMKEKPTQVPPSDNK